MPPDSRNPLRSLTVLVVVLDSSLQSGRGIEDEDD
jgi:hypothetical protein